MRTTRSRGLVLLAIVTALAIVVAGCGSSNKGSGSSTAAATPAATGAATSTAAASTTTAGSGFQAQVQADVAKLLQRPTSIGITEPVKGGIPKGKNVIFIQCGFPDCATIGSILEKVTNMVGWHLKKIPTQFTPESIKATWDEIVREKPDAIITTGSFEQSIYKSELAQVQKLKIPIIGFAEAKDGPPWLVSEISAETYVAAPTNSIVSHAAQYVAAKLPNGGKVLAVNHPGVVIIETMVQNFKAALAKYCPKCTYESTDIPAASIGTDAGPKLATYLQTHPDYKFIFFTTPDVSIGLAAAEKGAGVKPVPIVTSNTNPAALDRLAKGEAGLTAAIPTPFGGEAEWRAVDALSRFWAGQSVEADGDSTMPSWIIESSNVPADRPLPMVADYQAQFKKLWGMQ